jgi:ABC-2 type transport system ATP-binding protein
MIDDLAVEAADLAVEAAGLEKSYGSERVLAGLDLRVPAAHCYALLGPNGAGKTTTVRILATLVRPDAGRATVAGCDLLADRAGLRSRISLSGQYTALDGLQTGAENLRMVARLAGVPRRQAGRRSAELLERFGLSDVAGKRVASYSGGLRRRLDLAASLVSEPSVIFLDEPTTGLDLPSRLTLWEVIGELRSTGVTVFLTTQYLEEADHLADTIGVINAGRVVAEGSPRELKQRVGSRRLELTLTSRPAFDEVARAAARRIVSADGGRLSVSVATDGSAAQVRDLLDSLDPAREAIASFAVRSATLDDVFLALTRPSAKEAISV